jgi:subtilisin family serine protease
MFKSNQKISAVSILVAFLAFVMAIGLVACAPEDMTNPSAGIVKNNSVQYDVTDPSGLQVGTSYDVYYGNASSPSVASGVVEIANNYGNFWVISINTGDGYVALNTIVSPFLGAVLSDGGSTGGSTGGSGSDEYVLNVNWTSWGNDELKEATWSGTPNDPYYSKQWNMQLLNMPEVWNITKGDSDVVVAVIDSGLAELSDNPENIDWVNAKSYAKKIEYVYQTDMWGNVIYDPYTGQPVPVIDPYTGQPKYNEIPLSSPEDEVYHGTHVAGTIAQATNNNYGGVGMAPNVTILPVRVLDDTGQLNADLEEALNYAKNKGADVVNMSLGGPASVMPSMETTFTSAKNAGVFMVVATGNGGQDHNSSAVSSPALYDSVMGVGSVKSNNELTFYSNYDICYAVTPQMFYSTDTYTGNPQQPYYNQYYEACVIRNQYTGQAQSFPYYQEKIIDIVAYGGQQKIQAPTQSNPNPPTLDLTGDGQPDGILQETISKATDMGCTQYGSSDFYYAEGTSMATPHVAGLAALLKSIKKDASFSEMYDVITSTANRPSGLTYDNDWNNQVGYGVINPLAAVKEMINRTNDYSASESTSPSTQEAEWEINVKSGTVSVDLNGNTNYSLELRAPNGSVVASGNSINYAVPSDAPGRYKIKVLAN